METHTVINRISCQPIHFGTLSTDDEDDDVFESPNSSQANTIFAHQQHPNMSDLRVRKDAQNSEAFSSSLSTNRSNASVASPAVNDLAEEILHKTILVGDSGVGKTSLLVQFDTGKFQQGSFAATVGIGFTVMLLGDSGVGKTCLLVRFRDGAFLSGSFIATVGIDFRNKLLNVDGSRVKLQIWDTAGQERFRSVTHAYYRDAHALLLLYDVTNTKSFENTRAWLAEISEYAHKDVIIMLIGNKSDSEQRSIRREDGERLAREFNVSFMETSAKTGMNVEQAFMQVARCLKNRQMTSPESPIFAIKEYIEPSNVANRMSCVCNTA